MGDGGLTPVDTKLIDRNITANEFDLMFYDEKNISFQYLLNLGAEAIVFEGAGNFLPIWRNSPMPNHVIIIDHERIYLFANTNIQMDIGPQTKRLPTAFDIFQKLKSANHSPIIANKYLIESGHRASVADRTIHLLLERANI